MEDKKKKNRIVYAFTTARPAQQENTFRMVSLSWRDVDTSSDSGSDLGDPTPMNNDNVSLW